MPKTYQTAAAKIRTELKAKLGLTSRDVSVRDRNGSAYLSIKSEKATLAQIKEIAEQHERYQRCEATQEILCGGNTFVHVSYDSKLKGIVAERIEPDVDSALTALESYEIGQGNSFQIEGVEVLIMKDRPGSLEGSIVKDGINSYGNRYWISTNSPRSSAESIASMILDAK